MSNHKKIFILIMISLSPLIKKNGICIANKPFFPKKEKFPFDPGKIQKNNLPSLIKAKK